ncbi:hypothetical protein ACFVY1_43000 [Streptomyces sp. NPDC058293]|uniref:hypothetical protein n=1 Tax=Streptomyces sp. NPDC058293 TaxID=3346429 RepID=UPI0036E05AC9
MTTTAPDATRVAPITTGLDRLRRSLHTAENNTVGYRAHEPAWDRGFVEELSTEHQVSFRMEAFGYTPNELHGHASLCDDLAMAGPLQLLTREGAHALRGICRQLKSCAVHHDYVVSHRLRNVETISPFVHAMVRDPAFLAHVSQLVGVPLIPHPVRDAGVQINFYGAASAHAAPAVAKWHLDGMTYVFTMTLSDHSEHDGGDYIYYRGHPRDFDADREEITARGQAYPDVHAAPFQHVGDTMFTRASRVYHAVTPVTRGDRITLAVSLFCPLLGAQDENRFWHSAPDDGLLRTMGNWRRLHQAVKRPATYCRREGVPILPLSNPRTA